MGKKRNAYTFVWRSPETTRQLKRSSRGWWDNKVVNKLYGRV
jgi:phage-related protein